MPSTPCSPRSATTSSSCSPGWRFCAPSSERCSHPLQTTHQRSKPLDRRSSRTTLKAQSPTGLLDVKAEDPTVVMAVPYWAWQAHQDDVVGLLHAQRNTKELEW